MAELPDNIRTILGSAASPANLARLEEFFAARVSAEAVAERDAHWMQRLTDLQEEYGRIEEARERRLVRAVADERREAFTRAAGLLQTEAAFQERQAGEHEFQRDARRFAIQRLRLCERILRADGSVPVATPDAYASSAAALCATQCGKPAGQTCAQWDCGPVATPTRCAAKHPRYGRCQLLAGHTVDHVSDQGADGDDDPGYSWPVATPTEPAGSAWQPFRNRDDWLRDQHARYHDEPGNMLGRDDCEWQRCGFWDAATSVLDALSAASPVPAVQPPIADCTCPFHWPGGHGAMPWPESAEQPEERAPSRVCDCGHLKERHSVRGRCELCGDGCRSAPAGQDAGHG